MTEGSSTNAWIVDAEGRVITRPLSADILPGVTRRVLLEAAAREGIEVVERAFTVEEARHALEAFISACTAIITPVVRVDGLAIGNGAPGSVTMRLRAAYDSATQTARR